MNSNTPTKVLTYKSGQFSFSSKHDELYLNPLFVESSILYKTINDLPILPGIAARIEEELIKRSIFSTAALEGNPLTEDNVATIIDNPPKDTTERSQREITNLVTAYDLIKSISPVDNKFELSEELIKAIHKSVTAGIEYNDNIPGVFRNHIVKVGDKSHGGIYTPPKISKDIKMLINTFLTWFNSEELNGLNPFSRAAIAHYHISLIHPFGDGNGRTARILEAIILKTSGVKYIPTMLSNYYYRNMDDYYWAFSKCIKNKEHDITSFIEFMLKGVIHSLNDIKQEITFSIRILTLRDYYRYLRGEKQITKRQYDFISILIENSNLTFAQKDILKVPGINLLYRNVSPSTIRRDMIRLLDLGLTKLADDNNLKLNLNVLD